MKLQRILLSGLAAAALLTGCVERTLILRSDPPGATVVVNGDEAGVAPAKLHFETYGTYEVVMSAPRHHRLRALVPVRPPWYEKVPFDFFYETLWPGMLLDEHLVTLKLEPLSETEAAGAGLNERELQLQQRVLEGAPAGLPPPPEGK
ncbi:MAG: PEGA domain-containing protein [Candidatus Brocadiia bacterium]